MQKTAGNAAGWALSLIDWFLSEYPKYSIREILYTVPLTTIYALLPASRQRHGDDSMPGFTDMAAVTARETAKTFLEAHYRII